MDSLDPNNPKRYAHSVTWPMKKKEKIRCARRYIANNKCIEMGIKAELYKKFPGAYYVDVSEYDQRPISNLSFKKSKKNVSN